MAGTYTLTATNSNGCSASASTSVTVNANTIVLDASLGGYVEGGSNTSFTTNNMTTSGQVGEFIFFDVNCYYGGTGMTATAKIGGITATLLTSATYSTGGHYYNHYCFYIVTTAATTSYSCTVTFSQTVGYLESSLVAVKSSCGQALTAAANLGNVTDNTQAGNTSCSGTTSLSVTTPSVPVGSYLMASMAEYDGYGTSTMGFTGVTTIDYDGDQVADMESFGGLTITTAGAVTITATDNHCDYDGASLFSWWVHP